MTDQSIEGLLKNLKKTLEKKEEKQENQSIFELRNPIQKSCENDLTQDSQIKNLVSKILSKEMYKVLNQDHELLQNALLDFFSSQGKNFFSEIIIKFLNTPKMQDLIKQEIKNKIDEIIR